MDLRVPFCGARRRKIAADDRLGEAFINGDVPAPDPFEGAKRVIRASRDFNIAVDRRDSQELEVGMKRSEHDGHGVIRAGIHIQYEPSWHLTSPQGRSALFLIASTGYWPITCRATSRRCGRRLCS